MKFLYFMIAFMLVSLNTIKGQGPLSCDIQTDQTYICKWSSTSLNAIAYGGSGVYTYSWSSSPYDTSIIGQEHLQNIIVSPLMSTTYILSVADGFNTTLEEITIYVNDPLILDIGVNDTICNGEYIIFSPEVYGGCTGVYSFQWSSYPEGFSSNIKQPTVAPIQNTLYILEIRDGMELYRDSILIIVEEPVKFDVIGGGIFCPTSIGNEIQLSGSTEGSTYTLHPVEKVMIGTGDPLSFGYYNMPGFYFVIAYDTTRGCTSEMYNTVTLEHFSYQDQICAVSVDSITGLIKVLWDESNPYAVAAYNIFREATNGEMEIIGEVGAGSRNFTDLNANSLQRAYVYGITTIDTCGTESLMSETHKTIHLSINQGINSYNLIWTPYIGNSYNTYYIYRRESGGNFQLIDSVPASVTSYSDINPPANVIDYIVSIKMNSACGSSRDILTTIYSNIGSTTLGVPDIFSDNTIHTELSNGKLIIRSNQKIDELYLFSALSLINTYNINDTHAEIDVSFLAGGIYFVKVTGNNREFVKKIMVF